MGVRPKLLVILAVLVVLPLGALGWLGWRMASQEQEVVESRVRSAQTDRLRDINSGIRRSVARHETGLLRIIYAGTYETGALREMVRKSPIIRTLFVLDARGNRWHPPPDGVLTAGEREFLERADPIWRDKQVFYGATAAAGEAVHGWYTWYWGNGANLLFWVRNPSGRVIGVDVDRARLLADIIAELPDSGGTDGGADGATAQTRIALLGADGQAAYQWGRYQPASGEQPQVRLSLDAPLDAWSLVYFSPPVSRAAPSRALVFNLAAGMAALMLALIGLAVYAYRESAREMREAAVRVSFVNQVSHELKTPLTNIRMYAELLEQRVADDDPEGARQVGVIVSESQRLSRLIGNVLTIARKQHDTLTMHRAAGSVDDCVQFVLDQFSAPWAAKGIQTSFTRGAGAAVEFDRDALVQMLGNLFSNVEKYAAAGQRMDVTTRQDNATTTIVVEDRGPGIPKGQEERIFEPFHRLNDRVSEGVTGTGIGLTIARELARRHGGDLRAVPSSNGARFELQLGTPLAVYPLPAVEGQRA
jgi:signal transduction histidine kinase